MARRLPPLNWLRAFEAAARHLSFTDAAHELKVSQPAVSQQVKLLEHWLGEPLFRRYPRGLGLTVAGAAYLPVVRQAFERLSGGTEELFGREHGTRVTVRTYVSFALEWLAPRLARFADAHPGIDVRITSSVWLTEFDWETVDLDIRFGDGVWPELRAERLSRERLFPVCAPALRGGDPPLAAPADLARHRLLHVLGIDAGWQDWLRAAGVEGVDAGRGYQLDNAATALDLAARGVGVALGWSSLARSRLSSGRLIAPFGPRMEVRDGWFLLSPAKRADTPAAASFRDWLAAEAALPDESEAAE